LYNELDMYDTILQKAFPYGNHVWGLEENSKKIKVVKCIKCHIARLYLVGHDIDRCK
jgi:hypothetical protein